MPHILDHVMMLLQAPHLAEMLGRTEKIFQAASEVHEEAIVRVVRSFLLLHRIRMTSE